MPAGKRIRAPWATEVLIVAGLGGFAAFRFWQALLSPQGVWADSLAYESVAAHPLLSSAFWAGSRPPIAPLLWKLTGSPTSFVLVQTTLAVIAWGFLAFTVGALARNRWRQVLATTAVLAFACTLPVTEWDWSVLSESLALASLATIFAFSIRYIRTSARLDAVALLCAAAVFALTRDEDIWTIALVGIAALAASSALALLEHNARSRYVDPADLTSRLDRRRSSRRLAALGGALVALALVVEVPAVVVEQRHIENVTDILIVRIFPYPDRVAWFAHHGMPDASLIDRAADQIAPVPDNATVVGVDLQATEFAALSRWITAAGPRTCALWLVEHPGFLLGGPFVKPPLTFNNANGDIGFYSASQRASTSLLDRILFPGFWGELATLAVALAFAWRRSAWRRELWVVGILGALGPVSMLLAWQGDGQEVTRHMVEGSVQTRLAILLFLLIGALGAFRRNDSAELPLPERFSAETGPLPRVRR